MERVVDKESENLISGLALSLISCVILGKSLNLSLPLFPHFEMRVIIPAVPTSQGCCED